MCAELIDQLQHALRRDMNIHGNVVADIVARVNCTLAPLSLSKVYREQYDWRVAMLREEQSNAESMEIPF